MAVNNNSSSPSSSFPFTRLRKGQRELIGVVEKVLGARGNLLVQAPTGIGKTAAVLAPCLDHALDDNNNDDLKVLFLTPRHSQHRLVIDTLLRIHRKKNNFTATDLIGKRWLCGQSRLNSKKDDGSTTMMSYTDFQAWCRALRKDNKCRPYRSTWKKHYRGKKLLILSDRARCMLDEIDPVMHAEEMKSKCRGCCPYELFLAHARRSRVIVADYLHLFQLGPNFLSAKLGTSLDKTILIVDEAHNLPARLRELWSARLTLNQLNRAASEAEEFDFTEAGKKLRSFARGLRDYALGKREKETIIQKEDFIELVADQFDKYDNELLEDLDGLGDEVRQERRRSHIGGVARFLAHWMESDEDGYARILETDPVCVRCECLDPRLRSGDMLNRAYSSILMSGTLLPMEMYEEVLGLDPNRTAKFQLPSPFPPQNRCCLIVPGVTTLYRERCEEEYERIAKYLGLIAGRVSGNIGVFFPSYNLMNSVYWPALGVFGDRPILVEKQQVRSKEERAKLYDRFARLAAQKKKKRGGILFAVISGSFGEGIDYPGKIMECVVIVGLPLERPDLRTKALIDYYQRKFGRGWDYGYVYPAMNRALQASGRCIRSETDRGVLVFMDRRFAWPKYHIMFPEEFEPKITSDPAGEIEKFFSGRE